MRIKKIECDDFERQNLKNEESRIKIILEGSQSPAHRTGQGRTGKGGGNISTSSTSNKHREEYRQQFPNNKQ